MQEDAESDAKPELMSRGRLNSIIQFEAEQLAVNAENNFREHLVEHPCLLVNVHFQVPELVKQVWSNPHLSQKQKQQRVAATRAEFRDVKNDVLQVPSGNWRRRPSRPRRQRRPLPPPPLQLFQAISGLAQRRLAALQTCGDDDDTAMTVEATARPARPTRAYRNAAYFADRMVDELVRRRQERPGALPPRGRDC
ncbi:hypothetical protein CDCA_CDCA14G3878 [Cyanidium caldarium]|uniref:Uncharacterized protein n=1 Tax=Cyanidium caldarium TaxID=2771 RepID=A0AAV9IZT9_CYACA|nr:hypothetical protein CDCA_CDCA14G3878 [Cyanidium caldarium]